MNEFKKCYILREFIKNFFPVHGVAMLFTQRTFCTKRSAHELCKSKINSNTLSACTSSGEWHNSVLSWHHVFNWFSFTRLQYRSE